MKATRRQVLAAMSAASLSAAAETNSTLEADAVKHHDAAIENILRIQIADPSNEHCGAWPDAFGLYYPGSSAAVSDSFTVAFLHPKSKFHKNPLMLERMKLGIEYAVRKASPEGNVYLPITNFNSPPDTAFATLGVANAAILAKKNGATEILRILDPFLINAKRALLTGGVHTPNHRWVVSSALAMLYQLDNDPRLLQRIDQWLAEKIDVDEDGQYDERSIIGYNIIVDRALITLAHYLKRPELLEPVRRNLDSAFFLMHPDGEMVTEISHRQDRDTRGTLGVYWFAMHYLAIHDKNPRYAWAAEKYASKHASLSVLMAYPELLQPLPQSVPPSSDYQKDFRSLEIARIRRGRRSATVLLRGDSRFFLLRNGEAVLGGVRMASAFFGKAQFIPQTYSHDGAKYVLRQTLTGPYFQPFDPPRTIVAGAWNKTRSERKTSQVCFLDQTATITETEKGFRIRFQATGTADVPVAIEVNVRGNEGLVMEGLLAAPQVTDGFVLSTGFATVKNGQDNIRFGPGKQQHQYTQIRGAEPKLPGGSVYITGLTPFDHSIEFECS